MALQLELARLREENAAAMQQMKKYEADVANLVALGTVGHANPKQKLQYNSQCAPLRTSAPRQRHRGAYIWDLTRVPSISLLLVDSVIL